MFDVDSRGSRQGRAIDMTSIMIIEDNKHILAANADYFRLCDYEVIEASTLEKARAGLSWQVPNLVILDSHLPDGCGLDFCKELRNTSDIPVIMISAEGGIAGEADALKQGVSIYLRKPYAMEELLHYVKMLTNYSQRQK